MKKNNAKEKVLYNISIIIYKTKMGNTGSTYTGTRKVHHHHSRSVKNSTQRPETDKTVKGRGGRRSTTSTGAQQRKTRRAKKPKSIEEEERIKEEERIRKEEEEEEEFDDSI